MKYRGFKRSWQDVAELLVAVWLFVSPFALGFFFRDEVRVASLTFFILAAVISFFSQLEIAIPRLWEEVASLILGAAVLVSPWVMGFSHHGQATWNAVIVGIVLIALALSALARERHRPQHQQTVRHSAGH